MVSLFRGVSPRAARASCRYERKNGTNPAAASLRSRAAPGRARRRGTAPEVDTRPVRAAEAERRTGRGRAGGAVAGGAGAGRIAASTARPRVGGTGLGCPRRGAVGADRARGARLRPGTARDAHNRVPRQAAPSRVTPRGAAEQGQRVRGGGAGRAAYPGTRRRAGGGAVHGGRRHVRLGLPAARAVGGHPGGGGTARGTGAGACRDESGSARHTTCARVAAE